MKKIISVALVLLLTFGIFAFSGCTDEQTPADSESQSEAESIKKNPVAVIKVKDIGEIKVELYYDKAPNTVKNFVSLANKGFYDGLTFHRVISGFMIQGGCPEGNGMGDPGYSIKGEFMVNGFENDLKHTRGVISMARGSYSYDSAGSQFFIMHQDAAHLDGQYAAFGMVTKGIEVVDQIAAVRTGYGDKPVEDVIIESITVDTFGITYDEPETIAES